MHFTFQVFCTKRPKWRCALYISVPFRDRSEVGLNLFLWQHVKLLPFVALVIAHHAHLNLACLELLREHALQHLHRQLHGGIVALAAEARLELLFQQVRGLLLLGAAAVAR